MPIKTICPSCRITAEHANHLRGYQAGCPFCGSPMVVGLAPAPVAGANPWGQLSMRRRSNVLPIVLLAAGGVILLLICVVGAGLAVTFAWANRPRMPGGPPPVAERAVIEVPAPSPATISRQDPARPQPAVAGEMIAELSEAKTWTEPAGRSFSVNYRMLKGRPGPGSLVHWVVESADGQRATRQLMFHDLQESGKLAGQLIFQRGNGPYTTHLEVARAYCARERA